MLAASQDIAQSSSRARSTAIIAIAVPLAAAAAVALWLMRDTDGRPSSAPSTPSAEIATQNETAPPPATVARVVVTPRADADFEDSGESADRVISLQDGELLIEVANLATDQRFRTNTSDAEIETFHAKFSAAASADKLDAVVVYEGRIELRHEGGDPVTLEAGDRWSAPDRASKSDTASPSDRDRIAKPSVAKKTAKRPTPAITADTPPVAPAKAPPPAPGEREFRAGWTSMRANKPSAAATSFDTACKKATHSAIGEDACFWAGVAARRAGKSGTARRYLSRFLRRYPSSSRAGEASALLGWILYDAGELDAAEKRFRASAGDRVPKVKRSAQKGLDAVKARRKARRD